MMRPGPTGAAADGRCDRALDRGGATQRRWSHWVPGRIEVLGKHTDYAGGRSILCALDRGFRARVAPRRDRIVRVVDVAGGSAVETELPPTGATPADWGLYVATVARRLSRDFPGLRRGVDMAFTSDLPPASGMSSSSALIIAVYLALARSNRLEARADFRRVIRSRERLAAYLGAVENGRPFGPWRGDAGVGTLGGNQDQVAILCAEAGHLARYAWSPVHREGVCRMPAGYVFALAASGVTAPLAGSARAKYNRVSMAVQRLTAAWNARTGRRDAMLFDALTSGPAADQRLREIAVATTGPRFPASFMTARLEQFVEETLALIPAAWDALARGALADFGLLVDRSQRLAEEKLGNQVPETVALQRTARKLGAAAASAFGAGFGGSVWALVPARAARAFLARWRAAYVGEFPARAGDSNFFLSSAGSPAS